MGAFHDAPFVHQFHPHDRIVILVFGDASYFAL